MISRLLQHCSNVLATCSVGLVILAGASYSTPAFATLTTNCTNCKATDGTSDNGLPCKGAADSQCPATTTVCTSCICTANNLGTSQFRK